MADIGRGGLTFPRTQVNVGFVLQGDQSCIGTFGYRFGFISLYSVLFSFHDDEWLLSSVNVVPILSHVDLPQLLQLDV